MNIKILCVDDSILSRTLAKTAVQSLGYDTVEAKNGEEAQKIIEEQGGNIRLMLLDWTLPGISGYEVLTWLKSHPTYQSIPVIMITALGHEANRKKALKAGVDLYITKPFSQDDLVGCIQKILKNRQDLPDSQSNTQ